MLPNYYSGLKLKILFKTRQKILNISDYHLNFKAKGDFRNESNGIEELYLKSRNIILSQNNTSLRLQ